VKDTYGKKWQVGDTVGVFLDTNDRTIVFSLNGELLVDPSAGDAAFTEIQGEEFVPACTLGIGQKCRTVHSIFSLAHFSRIIIAFHPRICLCLKRLLHETNVFFSLERNRNRSVN
jgi:hypothetical protein